MPKIKAAILVVEDEPIKRSVLADGLSQAGYAVTAAENVLQAEQVLAKNTFDVVLTDLRMPGCDGISFLRRLKTENPEQSVIVMTAYGTVETAVEAMRLGAFDYLQKPFSNEELFLKLEKLLKYEQLSRENQELRNQLRTPVVERRIIGQSDTFRNVLAKVHSIANTDTTVLIEGESGTGKELIARQIHATSYRSKGPFVAFSCAALPADLIESELFGHEAGAFTGATQKRLGRFEQAQDGTLFLDDIDDIPLPLQVKLVRVLQEHTFERVGGERSMRTNARILASTKKTLADLVAAGQFRQDLYYRINVVPIQIPPLRDRSADIPLLTAYFLEKAGLEMNRSPVQITAGALKRLCAYSWPGNVRQLEHYVSRMVALTAKDLLDEADLPELEGHSARKPLVSLSLQEIEKIDMNATLAEVEERLILWAMTQAKGNLAKAAEALGIPRSTLQYKLQKK